MFKIIIFAIQFVEKCLNEDDFAFSDEESHFGNRIDI